MNSHWLRAEREMSQIGRGSLNFKLAIGEMNFSNCIMDCNNVNNHDSYQSCWGELNSQLTHMCNSWSKITLQPINT